MSTRLVKDLAYEIASISYKTATVIFNVIVYTAIQSQTQSGAGRPGIFTDYYQSLWLDNFTSSAKISV